MTDADQFLSMTERFDEEQWQQFLEGIHAVLQVKLTIYEEALETIGRLGSEERDRVTALAALDQAKNHRASSTEPPSEQDHQGEPGTA